MKFKRTNLFAIATLIGTVILALLLPDDILSASPSLRSFADAVANCVPSINHYARWSKFPDVTKTLLALAWAAIPMIFFVSVFDFLTAPVKSENFTKYKGKKLLFVIFALYIFIPVLIYFSAVHMGKTAPGPEDSSFSGVISRAMGTSRLALGFMSAVLANGYGILLASIVAWTKLLPQLIKRKRTTR